MGKTGIGAQKAVVGPELKLVPMAVTVAVGLIIWFIPPPAGLEPKAWQLFAIFVATITGLIVKPLPMGAIAVLGIAACAATKTVTVGQALSGFSNTVIWLIVIAFFISRGFIKTGLGARIAYLFVSRFGKKTLGLSYSLLASDLVLSPAIPSNTARGGGIIMPIIRSLAATYGSNPGDGTERRIGAFLTKTSFQGINVTSAMFMTAMAANPLIVTLAKDVAGLEITWTGWMVAALVPGLVTLAVLPLFIFKVFPPEIRETPGAAQLASEKLREMGPVKTAEKVMLFVFLLILSLWIFGDKLEINATTTALIGLSFLLLSSVLTWEDIKNESSAWDTLVWFAALVMMASFLNSLGMIPWFSESMSNLVGGMSWLAAFLVMVLVYYYSHYFFASNTAHVSAMYAAFLAVMIVAGAPAMLAALVLAFFSSLFSSTTHYGTGPAPVYFGTGFVSQNEWWKIGFFISIIHIVIWVGIGGAWWKILGHW